MVRRQPAYCSRSSRLLGVSPPPPSTQEQCSTLAQPLALGSYPLHLATFHCLYGSQVTFLLQQLYQGGELWQAVSSLAALQEQYRGQVEVGRGRVGVETLASLVTVVRRCREQSAGAGFGCRELQGGLALSGLQPGLCQEPGRSLAVRFAQSAVIFV